MVLNKKNVLRALKFSGCIYLATLFIPDCLNDGDCNLNGICSWKRGACICDAGWRGSDCGELDLLPAARDSGYNLTALGTSSWGGRIIRDPGGDKIFHLIMAEFTNGCGLDHWSPYSRIIRAESLTGPAGPYHFATEVVGTFSHNPTVVYSSADQLYLLYYIGCEYSPPDVCSPPSFTCGPGNYINGESGISVMSSTDLKEWISHGQVINGRDDETWDADVTNPSPWPLYSTNNHTSSMLLAYRGCPQNCEEGPATELLNLATASTFKGPYTRVQDQPIISAPNEDPFIWQDKRGNFHMLLHSTEPGGGFGDGPKVGRHAYATQLDGPWQFNGRTLAYSTLVHFSDGTTIDYFRRERPQLFFSDDGKMTPLYMTNGVQERGRKDSYTIIQPLGSGSGQSILDSLFSF